MILKIPALILISAASFAGDVVDYSQYVQFNAVNTGEKDYCFSRKNGWSSGEAPEAGYKYYVPEGKVLASEYSNNDPHVFKGDELAIAGGFLHARTTSDKVTTVPVLAFCNGGYFTCGEGKNEGRCPFSSDCVIIRSDSSNPAQLRFPSTSQKSARPELRFDMHGESDAEFEFANVGNGSNQIGFTLTGALTNYCGTMTISDGARPKFVLADNAVPYTLKIADGGILDVGLFPSDLTVGTLKWNDDGVISVSVTTPGFAKVVVTNAMELSGTPRLVLAGVTSVIAGEPPKYPILTLAGAAAENVPDLSVIDVAAVIGALPSWKLIVTSNDDGTKTVSATYAKKIVTVVKDYDHTDKEYSAFYSGNESYWSNGSFPTAGYDYYVISNMLWYKGGPSVFKGDSLTVAPGKTLRAACNDITVDDLHLLSGSTWMFLGGNNAKTFSGRVTVWPGDSDASFSGYQKRKVSMKAPICGNGNLRFTLYAGTTEPGISYSLEGDNSAFTGRITISTPTYAGKADKDYPATPNVDGGWYTSLQIKDGSSLGGVYSGMDTYRAVILKNSSRLVVANDITLGEPTRGMLISGVGYVEVKDGAELSMENQLTLSGRLIKLGGGVLSLGGSVAFSDGSPDTVPTAGANELFLAEGVLKVTDADVCSGMAVSFSEGTRLVLGLESVTDPFAKTGLRNVAWDVPVTATGAIPVEFDLPSDFDSTRSQTLGICTVNPVAAESLSVDSFSMKRIANMMVKVVRIENLDESGNIASVTFACNITPAGFRVLVR